MDLSELQQRIASFNLDHNLSMNTADRMLDLFSEVGEVSKEWLKASSYGSKEAVLGETWSEELADCLYAIICLANETEVDLENELSTVLEKYKKRIKGTGDAGSNQ